MSMSNYSIVIATAERPDPLSLVLGCLAAQSRKPDTVVVIDASNNLQSQAVCNKFKEGFNNFIYEKALERSSATQRNQGATHVTSPYIVFCDDDIEFKSDLFEKLIDTFEQNSDMLALSAREEGQFHRPPKSLFMKAYYRFQSGYQHDTWAAKFFGPAINTCPCYLDEDPELIASEWLPAGCLVIRTEIFKDILFHRFSGYAHMEDALLTHKISRQGPICFHKNASFIHHNATSTVKENVYRFEKLKLQNQKYIAKHELGLNGFEFLKKFFVLKCLITVFILKQRLSYPIKRLCGVWTA